MADPFSHDCLIISDTASDHPKDVTLVPPVINISSEKKRIQSSKAVVSAHASKLKKKKKNDPVDIMIDDDVLLDCSLKKVSNEISYCSSNLLKNGVSIAVTAQQDEVKSILDELDQPWTSHLYIPDLVIKVHDNVEVAAMVLRSIKKFGDIVTTDVSNFMGLRFKSLKYPILYFDKDLYPVNKGFESKAWGIIKNMIHVYALKCGYKLVSNGKSNVRNLGETRLLVCHLSRKYRGDVSLKKKGTYRKTSLMNDRKNTRGDSGLLMNRRKPTKRSFVQSKCCRFRVIISYDKNGFYIVHGYGNSTCGSPTCVRR